MDRQLIIDRVGDGFHTVKDNGTEVEYFIYPEHEIHLNILPAGAVQEWHYHSEIEEVLVVTKGVLTYFPKRYGDGNRIYCLSVCV